MASAGVTRRLNKGMVLTELDQASNLLQQLLETQTLLAQEQAAANRLKEEELKVRAAEAENERRRLDLEAQDLALKRETLNRAEKRLQEVLERFIQAETKLITTDDSYGETVQRVMVSIRLLTSAQIDIEKALYALLSQSSADVRDARLASPQRLERLRNQELLLQHQETLHTLKLQAAAHGTLETPVKLIRSIENEEQEIAELEEKLS